MPRPILESDGDSGRGSPATIHNSILPDGWSLETTEVTIWNTDAVLILTTYDVDMRLSAT
jgi:hypothetical protein